mgnify:CR=1 FL=1
MSSNFQNRAVWPLDMEAQRPMDVEILIPISSFVMIVVIVYCILAILFTLDNIAKRSRRR